MTKVKLINTCGECEHCRVMLRNAYCVHEKVRKSWLHNYIRISKIDDILIDGKKQYIPDWCPLKDLEELK